MTIEAFLVHQHSSADAKIRLFRSLFRGWDDVYPAIREPQNRKIRLCAGVRQRMGSGYLREATNQVRGVPVSTVPSTDRRGDPLAPVGIRSRQRAVRRGHLSHA